MLASLCWQKGAYAAGLRGIKTQADWNGDNCWYFGSLDQTAMKFLLAPNTEPGDPGVRLTVF